MSSKKQHLHHTTEGHLVIRNPPTWINAWRKRIRAIARFAVLLTLFFFGAAVVFYIWMMAQAYFQGEWAGITWGAYSGNHGPWRHQYDLRGRWWQVLYFLVFAGLSGLVSLILSPTKKCALLLLVVFGVGFLFLHSHYWLVD